MPPLLLEVIVQTVADAVEAASGGADRLEVVRAIGEGGLTPPTSLVRDIVAATRLPLRVMVRENVGYAIEPGELPVLQRAASEFAAAGVDGLVIGFARAGEVLIEDLVCVLESAPGVSATFHRAFDTFRDPLRAIDELGAVVAIDRVLTSGGEGDPVVRGERLARYSARAGGRLTFVAGGGVDREALTHFARVGCVREVHVGRAARDFADPERPVSSARVRELRRLADGDV
jgi:copper homeostasis protein